MFLLLNIKMFCVACNAHHFCSKWNIFSELFYILKASFHKCLMLWYWSKLHVPWCNWSARIILLFLSNNNIQVTISVNRLPSWLFSSQEWVNSAKTAIHKLSPWVIPNHANFSLRAILTYSVENFRNIHFYSYFCINTVNFQC